MYDLCFCVVLYNKRILESETIVSLLENLPSLKINCSVVVFNNGPDIVEADNLPDFVIVHQVLINGSLSKIYNKTIDTYHAGKYVLFDDDTNVNKDYLLELVSEDFNVFFPKIRCQDTEYYPVVNNIGVQTISSGLALTINATREIKKLNGFVFDESFDLYGVDTAFCYFINKYSFPYTVSKSYLEHQLSHVSGQSGVFRKKEVLLANSAALIKYFNLRLFFQTGSSILWAVKNLQVKVLYKAFLSFMSCKVIR